MPGKSAKIKEAQQFAGETCDAGETSPEPGQRAPADPQPADGVTSMVRRLSAILKVYPPNRSTRVMKASRNAVSQRCGVPSSSGLPNITITTIASGISDAMPSTTPVNRLAPEGRLNGIESSW